MSGEEIEELRDEIVTLQERVSALEAKITENPEVAEEARDLRSFVADFDPETHAERALAIAYYLEQFEGQEEFTSSDIVVGYEEARMRPPANMSDVLADCEEKNWVMRSGKDGQTQLRQLTHSGIEHAQEVIEDGN